MNKKNAPDPNNKQAPYEVENAISVTETPGSDQEIALAVNDNFGTLRGLRKYLDKERASRMKQRICPFDMAAIPASAYSVLDDGGEIYLCNSRCLCLCAMTLATRPALAEELKTQKLKLETPNAKTIELSRLLA